MDAGIFMEPAILVGLLIAIFSKRLSMMGEYFISHASLFSDRLHNWIKIRKWKSRRDLIGSARGYHSVTLGVVRTYALLLVFVLMFICYILLVTLGPLKGIGDLPVAVQLLIASPIFSAEVLWLVQKKKMKLLIRIAEKQVIKRSTC